MAKAVTVKVEGLADLDKALGELIEATSSTTGKAAIRRGLMEAARPVAERARALVPVRTGELRDSIVVSTKLANPIGNAEFAAAMKAGASKTEAVGAMRDARREFAGSAGAVVVYVGAGQLPHAHLVEFGTAQAAPHPYMRPAWEQTRDGVLDGVVISIGAHIGKAAKRAASRGRPGKYDTRGSKG